MTRSAATVVVFYSLGYARYYLISNHKYVFRTFPSDTSKNTRLYLHALAFYDLKYQIMNEKYFTMTIRKFEGKHRILNNRVNPAFFVWGS